MATKKTRGQKPTKGVKSAPVKSIALEIVPRTLDDYATEAYLRYGNAVLEDRAIPDFRDGMIPVVRRLLWVMHQLGLRHNRPPVKAARVVGDTMGRFHPHGDTAIYGALVGMANNPDSINNARHALVEGHGNWGSLSEPGFAAMRYTEARLTKLADAILFDKFYLPVVEFVPNYDSKEEEPLVLPALLPVMFLNGVFGIAPGATASIPSFNADSLLAMLDKVLAKEELTPKVMAGTLRVTSTFAAHEVVVKGDERRKSLFTSTKGSVQLRSKHTYDEKKRTLRFTTFANPKLNKAVEKILTFEGVASAMDDSTDTDRIGTLTVTFKPQSDKRIERLIERCVDVMSARGNYVLNFTRRFKNDIGQADAKMKAMTLATVFESWVKWRIALEKKACSYWIAEDDKEIRRLQLLVQACDLIDFIVALLKDKKLKSSQAVYEAYAKKARVSAEEAKYVMSRPIISLRSLSRPELLAEIDTVKANSATLEKRRSAPRKFLRRQIAGFAKLLD